MNMVFLSLLLTFELIPQAALLCPCCIQTFLKSWKFDFEDFYRKNYVSCLVSFENNTVQTVRISKIMIQFWSKFHIQIPWYGFTRDNRFLLTFSKSLPGKQKNPSSSTSRHISNRLSMYLFLDSELNSKVMKVQVKRAFINYFFVTKRAIRKQTGPASNFLQPPVKLCRGSYIPYFKITPPLFEECLIPHVEINKMLNQHSVYYHPSPSELTSRMHPLTFLWTRKGFILQNISWIFFLRPVHPTMVEENFQIDDIKITGKYIYKSKNWVSSFLLMPQANVSPRFLPSPLQQKEIIHFLRGGLD